MKHLIYLVLAVVMVSCNDGNVKLAASAKPVDSVSYAIGVFEAYSTLDHIEGTANLEGVDYDYLLSGYKSTILNAKSKNDSVKQSERQWASKVINRYLEQKIKEETEKAKVADSLFLEENAKNDSIVVLPSGLQYKIVAEGTGISPATHDTVNVIYTGTLTDGNTFDSSRGKAAKLLLSRTIPGWQEGLPLMKEGAKYKFYVPSRLAYGDAGRLAGKVLLFDVELVSVSKGVPPAELNTDKAPEKK
jgi:FKBP-type peptidyl-prolyl cis-trans isomerase